MAWNQPTQNNTAVKAAAKKSPTLAKGIIAGLLVVGLLATVWFCFFASGNPGRSAKDQRAAQGGANGSIPRAKNRVSVPKDATSKEKNAKTSEMADRGDVSTNGSAVVSSSQSDKDKVPLAHPRKPRVFKHASDQILAMVAQMAEGKDMPPMPIDKNFEKEFLASLKEPIEINDDDTDRIKAMKQAVSDLRKELSERAEKGESAYEILREYEKRMAEDYKTRSQIQQEARQILESGDREGAKKFVTTMNIALQQMGIKKIDMPMTAEERKAWASEFIKQRAAEKAAREKAGGKK